MKEEKSYLKKVKMTVDELVDEQISHFRLNLWDGKPFEQPNPNEMKPTEAFLNSPNYFQVIPSGDPCSKDNSLYLTINQHWFDKIASGEKSIEYREIRDTTMNKYLDMRESSDGAILDNPNLPEEAEFYLQAYNEGIFNLTPRFYEYLRLGVGYNKNRDTAVIRIKGMCFIPDTYHRGGVFRFDLNNKRITGEMYEEAYKKGQEAVQDLLYKADGPDTAWIFAIHLGEIVDLKRGKE